ncbi:hypothetical protein KGP87_26840 [Burkholderia multivorans]|uniref:hypothetical protein n=1 Tax=Burkholderia multivorans TaxID=87883 RepID=UPI0020A38999|nr:hypothetical protein [Burkholderia multivorans]MCO8579935.1 hypothetical protein [Burkholderia multivorans]
MAAAGGGMAVLPQFQGDFYTLQRQQALAQALAQNALQPQQIQPTGSGPYTIVPKFNIGTGLTQLGQALLAAKLGNQVSQGFQQLGANQAAAFGFASPQQSQQSAPTDAQGGPVVGSGDSSMAPGAQPVAGGGAPQAQGYQSRPQSFESPLNPAGLPPALAYMGYATDPGKYFETQAQFFKPAEIVQQIRAAGIDPSSALGRQIAQQSLAKANYIAPTSLRPGGYMYDPMSGTMQQMPNVPEGFTAQRGANGQWQIVPVPGALDAMSASAAAKAGGSAQYQLKEVWDPTANGGQGGYVQQSVANVANAANGGGPNAPLGIRNNNPGNLRPGGQFAQYPDMQTGLQALDNNLQAYGKQGINTVAGVISKWAPPNENDTNGYIKEVSQRLGISPNQKIDLSNPLVRQSLATAIALRENGPSGVFGGGSNSQPKQGAPMAAEPPLGTTQAANTSQGAPSVLMEKSYKSLSDSDANYQQSREALSEMIDLAQKKGTSGMAVGMLPEGIGTRISPDAAKYQKLHATYVSLQGKGLGETGSDAARATINESVPTYDKPQSAMVSGLQTQLNNLDMAHMKTQFLSPLYQQGNEKAYAAQSAAFDQNIKPTMVPILQMSGPQQQAAVKAAINANPALRSNFEWAFNNGLLK